MWLAPAILSNEVVLAHGNGPQLTPAMLRSMEFDAATKRPKIEACCAFVNGTGKWAAIGVLSDIGRIISAEAGTRIVSSLKWSFGQISYRI